MTRRRLRLLAVPLALVGAGCMDVDYEFTVNDDGSGRLQMEVLLDLEQLTALAEMGGEEGRTPESICDEILAENIAATSTTSGVGTVVEVRDSERCGFRILFDWDDPADFATGVADLTAGEQVLGMDGATAPVASLTPTDGGGWRFEMNIAAGEGAVDGFDEMTATLLEGFAGDAGLTVSVALPGRITDHNGTDAAGVVTWSWDLFDPEFVNESQNLYAVSSPAGGDLPLAAFAGVALALVAVTAIWHRRRRIAPPAATARTADVFTRPAPVAVDDLPRPAGRTPQVLPTGPPTPPAPPAGWYTDPSDQTRLRWWDGMRWTDRTAG